MFISVNWSRVFDSLLNIILLSIPENIFLVMFCLIILKQFDFLGSKNEGTRRVKVRDILEVLFIAFSLAITSQVLSLIDLNPNIKLGILAILMPGLIIIVYRCWTIEAILKTFLCSLCSILVYVLIEFSYLPLVFYATNKTASYYTDSITNIFFLSMPEIIVDYSIIAFMLIKKVKFNKINLIGIILKSRVLQITTLIMIMFNMASFVTYGKLIWMDKILVEMPFVFQSAAITIVLLLPIVNISLFLFVIYYINSKQQYHRSLSIEMIEKLTDDLYNSAAEKKYEKVDLIIQDIKANIEDLHQE